MFHDSVYIDFLIKRLNMIKFLIVVVIQLYKKIMQINIILSPLPLVFPYTMSTNDKLFSLSMYRVNNVIGELQLIALFFPAGD